MLVARGRILAWPLRRISTRRLGSAAPPEQKSNVVVLVPLWPLPKNEMLPTLALIAERPDAAANLRTTVPLLLRTIQPRVQSFAVAQVAPSVLAHN
jgi:hypothetical protein